ncbi:TPA: type II toxin-antitoxin system VapC family toxin [Candidatus Micrarchaeota archaeon]|nr:type II toxin-antitoxin system VapC family toxin [Candidatus Micrarchaeota archaeon]
MALMDTSAVIDFGDGVKSAVEIVNRLEREGEAIKVSAITIFELASGNPLGLSEKMRRLLQPMQLIHFNPEHAELGGSIFKKLRLKGLDIGSLDSMIAGVALCENERIVTGNVKHFSRVEGLKVITY